ncbi:MAG: STAS domain-containing protein [Acidobacteriota bacterium]|nr:STAS domain-containing protein [Acidobacteriota bacterium]MDQ7088412.1 STAS domain-containing protein [Acidobacteriota bacterium]
MSHQVDYQDGIAITRLVGRITVGNALDDVREVVEDEIAAGRLRVIFDLSGVNFVDSAGLGELVACHRSLDQLGGRLVLAAPRGKVRDLIELTRIGELLPVCPTVEEALQRVVED